MLSAAKLPRQSREGKSRCAKRKTPDALVELQKQQADKPPAPRRFKFGFQVLDGVLTVDPKRVQLTIGSTPETEMTYSSAHAFLRLPDGFLVEIYAAEIQPTQRLMMYRAGDEVALGGLISAKNIMHCIDVPIRGKRP